MIIQSTHFNLGLDTTRMKDPGDAARQHATVDTILARFFAPDPGLRREIQILADEVGMGKTFVALAVAYSILAAMRDDHDEDDLRNCYQKVLVITPQNRALFSKWRREVAEFVKRCVQEDHKAEARKWFACAPVERIDELSALLRQPGTGPRVILTHMGVFSGGKLIHYDLKRRFLLGVLFRHWGNRFRYEHRDRLLRGAPLGWPSDPRDLTAVSAQEAEVLSFTEDELLSALGRSAALADPVEELLGTCHEIAELYKHNRDELFVAVENKLINIYRMLVAELVVRCLPLVIVDEAHNWKNGPSAGTNGFYNFARHIACRSRRALLLTATPFQLQPKEMLEILKVSDHLAPSSREQEAGRRRQTLQDLREGSIRPVLTDSAAASKRFARAWSRLPASVTPGYLGVIWDSSPFQLRRRELLQCADQSGSVLREAVETIAEGVTKQLDPDVRPLMREALRLYAYNRRLSRVMGSFVIRHRRSARHRLFRVGHEYRCGAADACDRPDRHLLHAAPGLDICGEGELPQYLLMRCVSEMKGGKGRSSLGNALTGCYSTLLHSAEGRAVQNKLKDQATGRLYLELLQALVTEDQDRKHPKLREVVEAVVQAWRTGEKSLIFCFRTNTADRVRRIIDERLREELEHRRQGCLGNQESLKALRSRLTGRDRDLIVLGLDRVLWSILWAYRSPEAPASALGPGQFDLTDSDLREVARLALRYGVDLSGERVDRVFLHRATEHVLARRMLGEMTPPEAAQFALREMAQEQWVSRPYGLSPDAEAEEDGQEEQAHFDERGVHSVYSPSLEPDDPAVEKLAQEVVDRRRRARSQNQTSIFDVYANGASLWLGPRPGETGHQTGFAPTVQAIHQQLWELTPLVDGHFDWESRRKVFQAMRRSVFRESIILRLLPQRAELDEGGWGELLARAYFEPLLGQRESMADHMAVFLEDLSAASGSLSDPESARFALYDATRLRDQQFVALVTGTGTGGEARERIFAGFNTPLLPEVLVCTAVGQEGIDLHRHCRHVIHYDLAWNPAVLEQRTGRIDRIGSKTFRELNGRPDHRGPFLEVGVPFLAGTYDERMYEEVRLRAQTFEVLTGGELAADNAEGQDDGPDAEGREIGLRFIPLPEALVHDLQVTLHVWPQTEGSARVPNERTRDDTVGATEAGPEGGSGPTPDG